MRRIFVSAVLMLSCPGVAIAQEFREELAIARRHIQAKEWEPALDVLLRLWHAVRADDDLEREQQEVVVYLSSVGDDLIATTHWEQALLANEAALEFLKNRDGQRLLLMNCLDKVAACLAALGRASEALPHYEAALALRKRHFGDADHPRFAQGLNNMADCLESLGRTSEALRQFEAALAMWRRVHGTADHLDVAVGLNNVARCLASLGRTGEALPQAEAALAMRQRLFGGADHLDLALGLNNVAAILDSLGRAEGALSQYEAALAMKKRLFGDADHPDVAGGLNNVASSLVSLGRAGEALPLFEASLAMKKRIHGNGDHPDVAISINNLATCLKALGRVDEALPQFMAALAMKKRLFRDADHPDVANSLSNVASDLHSLGRLGEALSQAEAALAMRQRLYGDLDHPDVAQSLDSVAQCLRSLGRADEALPRCQQSVAMIERLRDRSGTSATLQQSFFDDLKRGGAFERLQAVAAQLARPTEALYTAERSRGRELLDLVEQQRSDPLEEAQRRARQRGDETTTSHLQALRTDLESTTLESDRQLHLLTRLDEATTSSADRAARRTQLLAESNAVGTRLRQLLDERARVLGDVLPVGRVRTAPEIQAILQPGELFLEFTITEDVALLYVLAPDGELEVQELPTAQAIVQRMLGDLVLHSSHTQAQVRGRDPGGKEVRAADVAPSSRELFSSLIPRTLWTRLQASRRVFLAAHRKLHMLPFELLVTDSKDGKPIYWLENGPPIAYVPSGSALHWLRKRTAELDSAATSLELLAIGDPGGLAAESEVPENGVFVAAVHAGGQGEHVGVLSRDILLRYDGKAIADQATLGKLRTETEAAITEGGRPDVPIPLDVWRAGATLHFDLQKGPLGIEVVAGNPRLAHGRSFGSEAEMQTIKRHGDLERIRELPRLFGAKAEAEAITNAWTEAGHPARRLLGAEATETTVFDQAGKSTFLHFACHGIAEEYAGQSLSMLVLAQQAQITAEDDGLLKLGDLLQRWRGRLDNCKLVVLSACRTNVGPTQRDDAPQALPIGFLLAGAPSVISSLWAVDDESTRILMTTFYGRLLAGETDKLKAFTDARKAVRAKYPDPFHWAPFLYIGTPE